MSAKRLALGALVAALGVAVSGSFSSSSGQSTPTLGSSYGAAKGRDGNHAWLRLDSSRHLIAALDVPINTSPKECSNRKSFTTYLAEGLEWDTPMLVRDDGTFSRRFPYDYREAGRRIVESSTVKGTVTDDRATVSVEGTVKISGGGKPTVRCTYGPQRWVLLN